MGKLELMTSNYTCHLRASGTNSFAYYGAVCLWKNQQENSKPIKNILLTNATGNVFCTFFNLSNIFYSFTMTRITFSFSFIAFLSFFLLFTLFQIWELFLAFLRLWFYLTVWKFICFKYWKWNVLIYICRNFSLKVFLLLFKS